MIQIINLQQLINVLNKPINIRQFIAICFNAVLKHKLNSYINKNIHQHIFKYENDTNILNKILNIIIFTEQDINIITNNVTNLKRIASRLTKRKYIIRLF